MYNDCRKNGIDSKMRTGRRHAPSWRSYVDYIGAQPVIGWIKDARGRMVYVNRRWCRTFNHRLEGIVGRTDLDLWPAAIAAQFARNDRKVLRSGMCIETLENYLADRSRRQALVFKFPLQGPAGEAYVGGQAIDISDHLKTREALRETQERLRLFIDHVREYALVMLDGRGRVELWNPGAERMFGYSAPEILGRDIRCTYLPGAQGRNDARQALSNPRRHGRDQHECRRARKDGAVFWARSVTVAVRGDDGFKGYVRVTRDISDEKRAEEIRARARTLEEANRRVKEAVRARTELLRTVSHEVRSPLGAMLGFCRRLRDGRCGPLTAGQAEAISDILEAGRHVKTLLKGYLDRASRDLSVERLRLRRIRPAEVVDEVVDCFEGLASDKGVRLLRASSPELPSLETDAGKVRQILYNLLSNALRHTPRGGRIRVSARPGPRGAVAIDVRDSGPGLPEPVRRGLFHAPVPRHGGRGEGLGLFLSRRIADALAGTLRARNLPGGGAAFTLELPGRAPERR